jgi:hypothetical protein
MFVKNDNEVNRRKVCVDIFKAVILKNGHQPFSGIIPINIFKEVISIMVQVSF